MPNILSCILKSVSSAPDVFQLLIEAGFCVFETTVCALLLLSGAECVHLEHLAPKRCKTTLGQLVYLPKRDTALRLDEKQC